MLFTHGADWLMESFSRSPDTIRPQLTCDLTRLGSLTALCQHRRVTDWCSPPPAGRQAEVPLRPAGGHRQAGRAAQEDLKGCGGVQTLLGGTEAGQTGQSTSQSASVVEKYC